MVSTLIKNISNIPGWSTKRRIVVIESDDWGSIRMPSRDTYVRLKSLGLSLDKGAGGRYNMYDTMASRNDFDALFEVLTSVKDCNGHYPKITAASLVANPDFEKIKAHDFQAYFYEPFTRTLDRYGLNDAFESWRNGIDMQIFIPEFHGREHLNVTAWMRALQNGDKDAHLAFEYGVWGYNRISGLNFQASFDLEFFHDLDFQKVILADGLNLFEQIHKRKAVFFVPPNGPINNQLEAVASDFGIRYISSPKIQSEVWGDGRVKKHFRYLGRRNRYNQVYITRNAFFEPSGSSKDDVNNCLSEIAIAFKWNKPAVISSHRVNYIGGHDIKNRDTSLNKLRSLLAEIVKRWPDVEFLSSSELGDCIRG